MFKGNNRKKSLKKMMNCLNLVVLLMRALQLFRFFVKCEILFAVLFESDGVVGKRFIIIQTLLCFLTNLITFPAFSNSMLLTF